MYYLIKNHFFLYIKRDIVLYSIYKKSIIVKVINIKLIIFNLTIKR